MNTIVDAIHASRKMTSLLEELSESLKYEASEYHVTKDYAAAPLERFFLYKIAGQEQLRYGTKDEILKYFRLRKISEDKVYGMQLIKPTDHENNR